MSQAVEAYRGITAMEEFRHLEILRERARHDEAQAIYNAELRGVQRGANAEREKWQGVVADKDTALAYKDTELLKQAELIAELQAKLKTK